MAYDDCVAERVQKLLVDEVFVEKKMFGGLAFLLNGNMCCGVIEDQVVLRLGNEGAEAALDDPSVREMDFTGKPIRSMVYLDSSVSDDVLDDWVAEAVSFTASLPAK